MAFKREKNSGQKSKRRKSAYDAKPGEYDFGRVRDDGVIEIIAFGESMNGLLKRGRAGSWTVISDEPENRGGSGLAPAPMQFFALAAVF